MPAGHRVLARIKGVCNKDDGSGFYGSKNVEPPVQSLRNLNDIISLLATFLSAFLVFFQ